MDVILKLLEIRINPTRVMHSFSDKMNGVWNKVSNNNFKLPEILFQNQ